MFYSLHCHSIVPVCHCVDVSWCVDPVLLCIVTVLLCPCAASEGGGGDSLAFGALACPEPGPELVLRLQGAARGPMLAVRPHEPHESPRGAHRSMGPGAREAAPLAPAPALASAPALIPPPAVIVIVHVTVSVGVTVHASVLCSFPNVSLAPEV